MDYPDVPVGPTVKKWMSVMRYLGLCVLACVCCLGNANQALGQVFGVELHNTLMPVSGAMGGTSIARPQDFLSGINGNPATLTQFQGTHFTFSSAWAEATVNQSQTGNIPFAGPPLIEPFSAKSSAPGSAVANIGLSQDLSELGLPATLGVGFITSSGLLADYSHVPASRGLSSGLFVFNVPVSLGVDLTDNWSVGATTSLGIGIYDGPFVGISNMVMDYGVRGTLGTNYKLNEYNTVGAYYQTKQAFTFDNGFVLIPGPGNPLPNTITQDVDLDLPENIGLGFANTSLMDGRLLLATDLLYKVWENAETFGSVYDNQWVVQFGSQYSIDRYRLRAGYVWAENPIDQTPGTAIGGVIEPGDVRAVRLTQGLMAVTSQHRISGGIGVQDFLPGVDMDMMAGGMFRSSEQLGDFTSTSIASYWIGAGLTWRFGRGACGGTSAPNSFLSSAN
jgi:long-chain fatty acid transport protein